MFRTISHTIATSHNIASLRIISHNIVWSHTITSFRIILHTIAYFPLIFGLTRSLNLPPPLDPTASYPPQVVANYAFLFSVFMHLMHASHRCLDPRPAPFLRRWAPHPMEVGDSSQPASGEPDYIFSPWPWETPPFHRPLIDEGILDGFKGCGGGVRAGGGGLGGWGWWVFFLMGGSVCSLVPASTLCGH